MSAQTETQEAEAQSDGPLLDLTCTTSPAYDSSTHTLTVRSGYTVTLGPGRYHLCDLTVEGGVLQATGVGRPREVNVGLRFNF